MIRMDARFVALVRSFPVLGGRAGLAPAPGVYEETIELAVLDAWAAGDPAAFTNERGPFPGEGAKDAARFVLNVWSSSHAWRAGKFDLFHALRSWDHEQIAAFQAWARNPFFP